MRYEDIKDEKLIRLVGTANNAGGSISEDMWLALKDAKDEAEFELSWLWKLRNEINRQIMLHNKLAEKLGYEKYSMV